MIRSKRPMWVPTTILTALIWFLGAFSYAANTVVVIPLDASTEQCFDGQIECAGACADLTSDEDNCGSCGGTCPNGHKCTSGSCVLNCQSGLANCSGKCVDLTKDEDHCGSCINQCGVGQFCNGGTCN